ncbi:hypothetical protein CGCA056_v002348 [Colletotrichum aenigma]|nr:hypothetical protein CGCA056_v002348 [Colletotrichum aenigma]
MLLRSSRPLST